MFVWNHTSYSFFLSNSPGVHKTAVHIVALLRIVGIAGIYHGTTDNPATCSESYVISKIHIHTYVTFELRADMYRVMHELTINWGAINCLAKIGLRLYFQNSHKQREKRNCTLFYEVIHYFTELGIIFWNVLWVYILQNLALFYQMVHYFTERFVSLCALLYGIAQPPGIHRRPGEPLAEGSRRRENKQGEGFKLGRNTSNLNWAER